MNYRALFFIMLCLALGLSLAGCSASPTLASIQITPSSGALQSVGGTVQFSAVGIYTHGKHPTETRDITHLVTWTSSTPATATINSSGLATSVGTGTTTITAALNSSLGPVTATATLTVTAGSGGGSQMRDLTGLQIIPGAQTLNSVGETTQFIVIGTFNSSPTTQNMAGQVTWQSSDVNVASITPSGLATAVGCATSNCSTTISATANALSGATIASTATLNVNPGASLAPRTLSAITIIPGAGSQTLNALGETAQFIAIGTYTASPTTQDLTNTVTWQSSDVDVATVNSSGLATAVNCPATSCVTFITASAPSTSAPNSNLVVQTSNLTVKPGSGGTNLPSLSVYQVGAGTGTVVSSPAGINCTSGTGCTGFFQLNSSVTLTATPSPGSTFGGWSSNCTPTNATTCTVVVSSNQTVGAILN